MPPAAMMTTTMRTPRVESAAAAAAASESSPSPSPPPAAVAAAAAAVSTPNYTSPPPPPPPTTEHSAASASSASSSSSSSASSSSSSAVSRWTAGLSRGQGSPASPPNSHTPTPQQRHGGVNRPGGASNGASANKSNNNDSDSNCNSIALLQPELRLDKAGRSLSRSKASHPATNTTSTTKTTATTTSTHTLSPEDRRAALSRWKEEKSRAAAVAPSAPAVSVSAAAVDTKTPDGPAARGRAVRVPSAAALAAETKTPDGPVARRSAAQVQSEAAAAVDTRTPDGPVARRSAAVAVPSPPAPLNELPPDGSAPPTTVRKKPAVKYVSSRYMTMPSKDPQDQQLRERTSSTQPLLRPPQTVRKQHPPPPPPPTGSRRIGTSASGRFPIDDIRETPRHVSHGATSGTTAVGMRSTRPVRMPAQPTRPPLGAIENHALQNGAHQQGSKKLHVPLGPRGHENAEAGGIASRRYSVLPRELLSHQPRRPLAPPHSAAAAATAAAPAATIRSTRIPDFEPESLSETVRPVAPAQQQSQQQHQYQQQPATPPDQSKLQSESHLPLSGVSETTTTTATDVATDAKALARPQDDSQHEDRETRDVGGVASKEDAAPAAAAKRKAGPALTSMATASTATTTAAQQNHHSSASATVTAFPEKDLLVRWNAALQWAYIEARAKRAFEARRKQREEQCVMATAHILQKREEIHKRYMDNERKRKLEEKIRVLSQQQESLERIVEAKLSVADSYKKLADSLKSSVVQLRLNNVTVRDPKLLRQSLLELADAATSILKDANGALSRAEQLSAGVVQIDDLMSRQKDGLLKCVGLVHRLQSLETMERSLMIDDIQRRLDMQ